jgi:hypothetical protein
VKNISITFEDFVQAGDALPPRENKDQLCYLTDPNTNANRNKPNTEDFKLLPMS